MKRILILIFVAILMLVSAIPVMVAKPMDQNVTNKLIKYIKKIGNEDMAIRVLIVDNHLMVRRGLRALLREVSNIEIVGKTENGYAAIECAMKLKPDVVVMGLSMRSMDSFEVTGQILKRFPQMKIMALSINSDKWNVKRALKVGMSGYLLKNCTTQELSLAIHTIFNGKKYFSSEIEPVLEV